MFYVAETDASIRQIIMERDLEKGKIPEFWTEGIEDIHVIAQGTLLCSHLLNCRHSHVHHACC